MNLKLRCASEIGRWLLIGMLFSSSLSGCGQMGPLYLPEKASTQTAQTPTHTTTDPLVKKTIPAQGKKANE